MKINIANIIFKKVTLLKTFTYYIIFIILNINKVEIKNAIYRIRR